MPNGGKVLDLAEKVIAGVVVVAFAAATLYSIFSGILEPFSVFCIGIIVMWLGFYFIVRVKDYDITGLTGVISVLLGGAALEFVKLAVPSDFWYYPIGLLSGLILYGINKKWGKDVVPSLNLISRELFIDKTALAEGEIPFLANQLADAKTQLSMVEIKLHELESQR